MAFETQEEAYEAFGLTPPEPEPAEEPAQPQETEPEQEPRQEQVEAPAPEPEQEDPLEKLRAELEEKHRTELEQARAEGQRKLDESIAGMGLTDPVSGEAITTWEQYQAFKDKRLENSLDSIARQTGMDRAELDKLIADHPEVRKAMQIQAEVQAAQQAAEQQQLQQRLNDDIAAIAAECPEVNDIDSLVNHPSYAQVAAKMRQYKGMGVAEAFFLVNRTQLAAGQVKADAQRVRNNLAGKGHLRSTKGQGQTGPHISAEQEAWYRRLVPGATAEQIRQHFTKHHKGKEN